MSNIESATLSSVSINSSKVYCKFSYSKLYFSITACINSSKVYCKFNEKVEDNNTRLY